MNSKLIYLMSRVYASRAMCCFFTYFFIFWVRSCLLQKAKQMQLNYAVMLWNMFKQRFTRRSRHAASEEIVKTMN